MRCFWSSYLNAQGVGLALRMCTFWTPSNVMPKLASSWPLYRSALGVAGRFGVSRPGGASSGWPAASVASGTCWWECGLAMRVRSCSAQLWWCAGLGVWDGEREWIGDCLLVKLGDSKSSISVWVEWEIMLGRIVVTQTGLWAARSAKGYSGISVALWVWRPGVMIVIGISAIIGIFSCFLIWSVR